MHALRQLDPPRWEQARFTIFITFLFNWGLCSFSWKQGLFTPTVILVHHTEALTNCYKLVGSKQMNLIFHPLWKPGARSQSVSEAMHLSEAPRKIFFLCLCQLWLCIIRCITLISLPQSHDFPSECAPLVLFHKVIGFKDDLISRSLILSVILFFQMRSYVQDSWERYISDSHHFTKYQQVRRQRRNLNWLPLCLRCLLMIWSTLETTACFEHIQLVPPKSSCC